MMQYQPQVRLLMQIENGWLTGARCAATPNCDDRPDENDIALIVIHCISLSPNEFGGEWIDCLFSNTLDPTAHPYFEGICHLRVSSHLLIRRDGEVVQYVPFHKRAYHAGISRFGDRTACNDFSIGIELEGTETVPYTDAQYRQLTAVIESLLGTYPTLSPDRITGHSDIAPDRKTDPGPSFDWERLEALLATHSNKRSGFD
jgi:AmpD protein